MDCRPVRTQRECDLRYLEAIADRMVAEHAIDCSDEEIERTLSPCVAGPRLLVAARLLRETGDLSPAVEAIRPSSEEIEREKAAYEAGFEGLALHL